MQMIPPPPPPLHAPKEKEKAKLWRRIYSCMFVLLSLTRLVIKRHFEIDSPRFLSRLFLADDDDPADVPLCTENKFFLSPSPTVWRGSIF